MRHPGLLYKTSNEIQKPKTTHVNVAKTLLYGIALGQECIDTVLTLFAFILSFLKPSGRTAPDKMVYCESEVNETLR